KNELRWNGGRIYTISKHVWYDHGAKRGGSTLELVDYHKGRLKRDLRGSVFFDVWREANELGIVPDPAPPIAGTVNHPNKDKLSDASLPEIELTKLTKTDGPLTKIISLARDGTLVKDGSACVMAQGRAERVRVASIHQLSA